MKQMIIRRGEVSSKHIVVHSFVESRYALKRIKKAIQIENREKVIPEIKYEIKATGDFYYFLPVEGQVTDFLDLVKTMLSRWKLPGHIISELKTLQSDQVNGKTA